jgi:hypothetical protein
LTRYYLKLIIPIAIVCLTFMLITCAIGTTQPPNPALRGFVEGCEDKPQPCWYGIVPGVTTAEEARSTVQNVGYILVGEDGAGSNYHKMTFTSDQLSPACLEFHFTYNHLSRLSLTCVQMQLGTTFTLFEGPEFILLAGDYQQTYHSRLKVIIRSLAPSLSSQSEVESITMIAPSISQNDLGLSAHQ